MHRDDLDGFVVELKRVVGAVAIKGWPTPTCRAVRVALPVVNAREVCKCTAAVTITLLREVVLCTCSGRRRAFVTRGADECYQSDSCCDGHTAEISEAGIETPRTWQELGSEKP